MKKFGLFKVAALAALVLGLACFVSCKVDDDESDYDGDMTKTVELTGTTNPTFKDGQKTLKDEEGWYEMSISGTTLTFKWLKKSADISKTELIYDDGYRVGLVTYKTGGTFTADGGIELTWKAD